MLPFNSIKFPQKGWPNVHPIPYDGCKYLPKVVPASMPHTLQELGGTQAGWILVHFILSWLVSSAHQWAKLLVPSLSDLYTWPQAFLCFHEIVGELPGNISEGVNLHRSQMLQRLCSRSAPSRGWLGSLHQRAPSRFDSLWQLKS